jgi:hypothetical protein
MSRRLVMALVMAISLLGLILVVDELEVGFELLDGVIGQVVFGAQVGSEAGESGLLLFVAAGNVEVVDLDVERSRETV